MDDALYSRAVYKLCDCSQWTCQMLSWDRDVEESPIRSPLHPLRYSPGHEGTFIKGWRTRMPGPTSRIIPFLPRRWTSLPCPHLLPTLPSSDLIIFLQIILRMAESTWVGIQTQPLTSCMATGTLIDFSISFSGPDSRLGAWAFFFLLSFKIFNYAINV